MTPAQANSLRVELLSLVSWLAPVETQLAEGRAYAATQSVARARDVARRLAEELVIASSDSVPAQDDLRVA